MSSFFQCGGTNMCTYVCRHCPSSSPKQLVSKIHKAATVMANQVALHQARSKKFNVDPLIEESIYFSDVLCNKCDTVGLCVPFPTQHQDEAIRALDAVDALSELPAFLNDPPSSYDPTSPKEQGRQLKRLFVYYRGHYLCPCWTPYCTMD